VRAVGDEIRLPPARALGGPGRGVKSCWAILRRGIPCVPTRRCTKPERPANSRGSILLAAHGGRIGADLRRLRSARFHGKFPWGGKMEARRPRRNFAGLLLESKI